MDWQLVIALNVMVISAAIGLMALRLRFPGYLTIIAIHALVLAVGAVAWWAQPDWLLAAVAVPFVPLVVAPWCFNIVARRAEARGDAAMVARMARWSMRLQPSDRGGFLFDLGQATRLPTDVDADRALADLEVRATSDDERAIVQATRATTRSDWPAAVAAAERSQDPNLVIRPLKIRALGETGRLDEMWRAYDDAKTRLIGAQHSEALLFVLAFTGRIDGVMRLLQGPLKGYPPDTQQFWLARARRRADPTDAIAAAALHKLATTAVRERSRVAAAKALNETMPPLSADADVAITAAAARLTRDMAQRAIPFSRLYATMLLMAVNLIMFAVTEWTGSSEDLRHLWTWGAMWPPSITMKGEWWRLATATILHFGPIHLAANMLMLSAFGRLVETRLGPLMMPLLYGICAVGSTAVVYGLMRAGYIPESVLIGASGAIFGLVGISLALDLTAWMISRDRLDLSRVASLLMLLGLQAMVDFAIPNVSFAGHASGLIIGLCLGGIVAVGQRVLSRRKLATS
jgi:rhomboid protease GluP